jgi:hypothetical protein
MDKKKFLVMLAAALATAAILVLLERNPQDNAPAPVPATRVVSQGTAVDTAITAALKAGSCAPTECRFSPVITPAFDMMSNGKRVLGIWNVARSSQTVLTLKNVSPDPVTISAVTLFMCLNDAIVPVAQVPAECRFLKISQSDYKGGTMVVKPGETVSTTLDADTHGQVAKLEFDTTRGPVILLVTVQ